MGEVLSSIDTLQGACPDFVVIGSMRAGTTQLHNWLSGVDGVSLPQMKETDYFIESKNWSLGPDWYAGLFKRGKIRGEVSPNYAKRDVFPGVCRRVLEQNRDVKIIYIVRDPVDRAVSQYVHSWYSGLPLPRPHELPGTEAEAHLLNTSRYAWQLEPWCRALPPEQILMIEFEDMIARPQNVMRGLARYLAVPPPREAAPTSRRNSGSDLGSLPQWWHDLRESPAGARLRAMAPARLVSVARSAVSRSSNEQPAAPDPPDWLLDRFRNELRADTDRLRSMTGRGFASWSV